MRILLCIIQRTICMYSLEIIGIDKTDLDLKNIFHLGFLILTFFHVLFL